jgi:hypothetical protein
VALVGVLEFLQMGLMVQQHLVVLVVLAVAAEGLLATLLFNLQEQAAADVYLFTTKG